MANEYGDLENLVNDVTSLDTARMTLRWALERLNTIEKEKADLKKNLTLAEETSKRLQARELSLKDAYESRSKTLEEKEDFYTKLEATMALLGEGRLDIQQLLKKEAKLDSLRRSLEEEYGSKFEELDRNQRAVIERWNARLLEVESQYASKLGESQKKYDSLRQELDNEHQERLTSLQNSFRSKERELNARIEQLEGGLHQSEAKNEARRRELEAEYLSKKRETEENYRKLKAMLEAGLEEKLRAADSDHAEQVRSLEASWQAERSRLAEEQRVREEQFLAAQARIKEIENELAVREERHNADLLKFVSEREAAFRDRLADLENEKAAKEQGVRELSALMEKRAQGWAQEKAALEAEFGRRLADAERAANERVAGLEGEYAARKLELQGLLEAKRSDLEKEYSERLAAERAALAAERAHMEEDRRLKDEAVARAAELAKGLEASLAAAKEEHNRELLSRVNGGEAAFREKLSAFESEKRSYNETINDLTDQLRRGEAALQTEKAKIAAEFEVRAAAYEARLARTEELFEQRRRSYDETIRAMGDRLEAAAKAAAEEKEIFSKELTLAAARASAEADERVAAARADYEQRKARVEQDFEARYGDRLRALEAEKDRFGEQLAERARQLEAAHARVLELEGAAEELRRNSAAAREELCRGYEAELGRVLEEGRKEAAAREERAAAEVAAARAEYEKLLAAADARSEARTGELHARLAQREELLAKAADERAAAEKAMQEAAIAERTAWSDERAALAAGLEKRLAVKVGEVTAEFEARLAEAEKTRLALQADLEEQKSAVLAEREFRAGFEAEKAAWASERGRFESSMAELAERFAAAQKEISGLAARNLRLAEQLAEGQSALNEAILAAQAEAGRKAEARLQAAVEARTEELKRALSYAEASRGDIERKAESEINLARQKAAAARQELAAVVKANADLEAALARGHSERQAEIVALHKKSAEEFEVKLKSATEAALLSARNELAGANAEVARLKAAAAEEREKLRARAAAEQERLRSAAVAEYDRLKAAAAAGLAESEAFAQQRTERLAREAAAAENRARSAEARVADLELQVAKMKESYSADMMQRTVRKDEETRAFIRSMEEKFEAAEAAFASKIEEERARAAARIRELERAAEDHESSLAEERALVTQKLDALAQREAELVRRENEAREAALKAESAAEARRNELEREYARKTGEMDRMRTELTRTISGLKRSGLPPAQGAPGDEEGGAQAR